MDACRVPFYLIKSLEMLQHPSVSRDLAAGCAEHLPLLTKILYRMDMKTQFHPFAELRKCLGDDGDGHGDGGHPIPRMDGCEAAADVADQCQCLHERQTEPKVDDKSLLRRYAGDFVRTVATCDQWLLAMPKGSNLQAQTFTYGMRSLASCAAP